MSQSEKWTYKALINWTTDFFRRKGVETPKLEAETLLSCASGKSRLDLLVSYDEEPNEEVRAAFRELVKRRAAGEPNAYLVGKKEFYSLDFAVNPDVLIPRPDTELLVLETIEYFKARGWRTGAVKRRFSDDGTPPVEIETPAEPSSKGLKICDVGVGSGCVAAALAKNIPSATLVGLDISASALETARRNVESLGLSARVTLLQSDLLAAIPDNLPEEERFDAIVSNPPYVSEEEYAGLDRSVREFEPRLALVGGVTGAELPIRLVKEAESRLKKGGRLALELSPTTIDAVAESMCDSGAWGSIDIRLDLEKRKRCLVAIRQ